VERRRGGFCYELNGLFAILLRQLGFDVTLLAAQVAGKDGGWGPEFDHLLLLVRIDGERWLADVGFGSSFREPLLLDLATDQSQQDGIYRISRAEEHWVFAEQAVDGTWLPQYTFTLHPRYLEDFAAECAVKQTSPFWRDRRICSRATPNGRITLSDSRLIWTEDGRREEQELTTGDACVAALRQHFGIED
jgi:N-hydroxyarylamine O-acetyltransferase